LRRLGCSGTIRCKGQSPRVFRSVTPARDQRLEEQLFSRRASGSRRDPLVRVMRVSSLRSAALTQLLPGAGPGGRSPSFLPFAHARESDQLAPGRECTGSTMSSGYTSPPPRAPPAAPVAPPGMVGSGARPGASR
jgi:hypothetical protein